MTAGGVRAMSAEDLPAVAALRRQCFAHTHHGDDEALARYLRDVLLENPWRADDLPCLVHARGPGRVTGFVGVVPRPLHLDGQRLRAAVFTQFMVDPAERGRGVGEALVREFLSGPQDLSITDVANDACRRVWERAGAGPAMAYSLYWTRTLRASAALLGPPAGRGRVSAILREPLRRLVDWSGARLPGSPFRVSASGLRATEPSLEEHTELCAWSGRRHAASVIHTAADIAWLERHLALTRDERPRKRVLRDRAGETAGWYAYLPRARGYSEVLQIDARPGHEVDVLAQLVEDALACGAIGLRGQAHPALAVGIEACGGRLRRRGPWTLVHARDPRLELTVHRGHLWWSRLDGEWWIGC